MLFTPAEVAAALARNAESVCQRYLSNGHRQGRYWVVGDVRNTLGRSCFVRLTGPARGPGAAGRWTDAATAEHGDLLDVIRASLRLGEFRAVMDEARRFLILPNMLVPTEAEPVCHPVPTGSPEAARRLLRGCQPIAGTIVERYLRHRGINEFDGADALQFHPRCYYRSADGDTRAMPAMVAAVTDLKGRVTGALRTWLADDGSGKAPVATPRRAMGQLAGHAVRFGIAADVMAAGEGVETILSLRQVLPALPMAAALSAAHLAAIVLPTTLSRLYIVRDDDTAGEEASNRLATRAVEAGIRPILLSPTLADFNDDLQLLGSDAMQNAIRLQLAADDVGRYLRLNMRKLS